MKFFFVALILSFSFFAHSEDMKKSKYNTEVYEKEDRNAKLSDVVKVIREMDTGTEVVFTKVGTYGAPADDTMMERLQESQKAKLPVQFTFNEDSRKILKVMAPQKPADPKAATPNK